MNVEGLNICHVKSHLQVILILKNMDQIFERATSLFQLTLLYGPINLQKYRLAKAVQMKQGKRYNNTR